MIFQIWSCFIAFYPKCHVDSDLQKDHDLKMIHSKSISPTVETMLS